MILGFRLNIILERHGSYCKERWTVTKVAKLLVVALYNMNSMQFITKYFLLSYPVLDLLTPSGFSFGTKIIYSELCKKLEIPKQVCVFVVGKVIPFECPIRGVGVSCAPFTTKQSGRGVGT